MEAVHLQSVHLCGKSVDAILTPGPGIQFCLLSLPLLGWLGSVKTDAAAVECCLLLEHPDRDCEYHFDH